MRAAAGVGAGAAECVPCLAVTLPCWCGGAAASAPPLVLTGALAVHVVLHVA
ncbi:hypothetical protein [Bifidobacterium oedipodis]|uniref:hypothetical protein n=1 Tax=Bifidobacterium oedipodis TaxID=2675322 RepID=UPI00145E650F|nr:hypothetical protein [Bifidobacterium sp. DSM 109957]